jgi:uncharacterized membrane protein
MPPLPELYLLHPAIVHFPIALLLVGWGAGVWGHLGSRWTWLPEAATLLLWIGTVAAWAAMGLGLLAENTAPHVPPAWQTLNLHRTLGYWAVGSFSALSILRWRLGRRWERLFLFLWLAACGVLLATAYQGGELVFTHGMGVKSE